MLCPQCGAENREGAKFCKDCAASLLGSCANCGATVQPGSKFCDQCGAQVTAARVRASVVPASTPAVRVLREAVTAHATDGERKTVSALFADIKGSTELERDLDPEEARALVDPVLDSSLAREHS
jgi:hypothetical protein